MGAPCRTALRPPTITNSQWALARARMILSAKFCTLEAILYEQTPRFMLAQSLGRRHGESSRNLSPVEVSLMTKIKILWIGTVRQFRGGVSRFGSQLFGHHSAFIQSGIESVRIMRLSLDGGNRTDTTTTRNSSARRSSYRMTPWPTCRRSSARWCQDKQDTTDNRRAVGRQPPDCSGADAARLA